jgi:cytochrome c oxidase assembly protein subunit 11
MAEHAHRRRTGGLAMGLAAVALGMLGLAFAAVPLYRLFCAATGYGGTPQVGPAMSGTVSARRIMVRFNADTASDLPWHFAPEQRAVRVRLGEPQVAFYSARNEAGHPVTGTALYNVTPEKAGKYFHKTACFCFSAQTLAPNQEMQLPVSFWVDPAIAADPSTAEVTAITLSYTFFRALDGGAASGPFATAGPQVGPVPR